MAQSFFLSLREGVSFQYVTDSLKSTQQELTPGILAALKQLAEKGGYQEEIESLLVQSENPSAIEVFQTLLLKLNRQGLLLRSVYFDSRQLATQVSISPYSSLEKDPILPNRKYVLSRFAYMHRYKDQVVLESPLSHSRITLHDWLATSMVHVLAQPSSIQDVCRAIPGLNVEGASEFVHLLLSASMLWELDDEGSSPEERTMSLQCWEFHDLLFHSLSRGGRHDHPAGGTMRFAGKLKQPPILKEIKTDEILDLYRPDMEKLKNEDPPYALVQDERSSIREYSKNPISDQQLGEFLFRVGRVVDYWKMAFDTSDGSIQMEAAPRPYPAAGGLYELELYVVVNRCENIESGFYYYDPEKHRLVRISHRTDAVNQLLKDASRSTGMATEQLQVMIIISARFQRLSWKYSSLAYAAILKNLGVLYQTMYLAATAMSLAPCAIGYGDSDLFAIAAGTDYYTETSVGEFLLGTKES